MIFISTFPLGDNVMASIRLRHLLKFLTIQQRSVVVVSPVHGKRKWSFVFKAALETAKYASQEPNAIVVSSIPGIQSLFAAAIARWILRKKFQLVLEVRDPFALNPALPWSGIKRWVGHLVEHILLHLPDRVIFLTTAIQTMYVNGFKGRYRWKTAQAVITNGYQTLIPTTPLAARTGKPLTITYAGHFYDRRHPLDFLKTLRDFIVQHPQTPLPIVQFAGQVHGEALQREIESIRHDPLLQKCVQWLGPLPHLQAMQLVRESDVNLLITHDEGSEYAIPGKLFEYIGAKRPVLAMTHDPLVKQLMHETHLGWICENQSALRDWLANYLNQPETVRAWAIDAKAADAYELETIHPRWLHFVEEASHA